MTDEAARIYARGRRSKTSSEEAWERLEELAESADWDTSWLEGHNGSSAEQTIRRR